MPSRHREMPKTGEDGEAADGEEDEEDLPVLNRLTCFVAMQPAELRPAAALEAKVAVYMSGGSTSHWACAAETHPVNATGPLRGTLVCGGVPPERLALL